MDYFLWFDPHEERRRAHGLEFRIANARQEGQEDVLSHIVEREESRFWKAVQEELHYLAKETAEQIVWPRVKANFDQAKRDQLRLEREFSSLSMQVVTPMRVIGNAKIGAIMAPANEQGEMGARITIHTQAPFQFTSQLPPMRELR